jgi:RNA polymerase sigma factor (sigma-70 family)
MTQDPTESRQRFEHLYVQTRVLILGYLARRAADPPTPRTYWPRPNLIAWRRFADIPNGDHARPWLYGVARRVLANYRRHSRVEDRLADTLRAQLTSELSRRHATADVHYLDAVTDRVAELSAGDREIIELSAYEHLTPGEIARVVGKSSGVIRVQLHRARRQLRQKLLTAGDPTPAQLHLTEHAASHGEQ